jgi:hypothetical protein
VTRSADETQSLKDEIEALSDKELIAEALRLRNHPPPGTPQKVLDLWDALIQETSAQLSRRFAPRGTKKEARGRLRSFCLARRRHE